MTLASKFIETDDILAAIRDATPSYAHVQPVDLAEWRDKDLHPVRRVTWAGRAGYVTKIPAKNVLFMEGNLWNPNHAAALWGRILDDGQVVMAAPPARVYRVTAKDIQQTTRFARDGELEYQLGMTAPWTRAEQGEYYAQLLDGNHRAAAALLAGEPYIYVYVADDYRKNVRKKDYE
jgi:hypothetical protein